MISTILNLLGAGLSLWDTKEKTRYQDKFIAIKTALYEEMKKPYEERNHAAIDDLEFQLKLLCDSFAAAVGPANTIHRPE